MISVQNSPHSAYLYAIVGNISFAVMQILFKQAVPVLGSFQVLYIRSIFLFLITFGLLWKSDLTPYMRSPRSQHLVIVRIVFVGGGVTLVYFCLAYLPVSIVTTLFNLGPIFIFFIEAVSYKKRLNVICLILTVISFFGVMLIIQPQFLFGSQKGPEIKYFQFYVFLMIIAAISNALNFHYIHDLSKSLPPMVNMLYSHLGFITASSVLCNFKHVEVKTEQITVIYLFNLVCIIGTAFSTQYSLFMANSLIKPSKTMPLGYVTVILGFLADVYLFETKFTLLPIIGMLLTSVGLLGQFLVSRTIREDSLIQEDASSNLKPGQVHEYLRDSRI